VGECVECITVVSVPDDQVISQGVNHRCVNKGTSNHSSPASSSSTTTDEGAFMQDLRMEISSLKRQLQGANTTIYHMQEKNRQIQGGGQSNNGLLRFV
jgi:hypothetical protein